MSIGVSTQTAGVPHSLLLFLTTWNFTQVVLPVLKVKLNCRKRISISVSDTRFVIGYTYSILFFDPNSCSQTDLDMLFNVICLDSSVLCELSLNNFLCFISSQGNGEFRQGFMCFRMVCLL